MPLKKKIDISVAVTRGYTTERLDRQSDSAFRKAPEIDTLWRERLPLRKQVRRCAVGQTNANIAEPPPNNVSFIRLLIIYDTILKLGFSLILVV
jgi:hypothetical protein